MKKINLLNSVQNYASRLLMLLCVLTLGIGSAWAGGSHSTHTATLNVAKGTGEGSVYAASSETATSGSESASFNCGGSSSGTHKGDLYAFATPKDGYTFKGWSESATSPEGADKANPLKVSFDVTDASSSKTYYAHFQKKVLATITFKAAANGTYTAKAGSTTKTVSTSDQSITTDESIDFTAIPASGYKFFGWYTSADGGTTRKYFSYSASATNNVFTENVNVYAEFISTSVATFNVKGTSDHYYDLAKGLTAAASSSSKVLVAASNGTVAAGAYTIPNGVTLLIPYESTNSVTTTPKDVQTWASLSEYRKLKLAADANLTVENGGAICLAGQQWGTSSSNPGPGSVLGAYSVLDMSEGGHITVANGGKLYAFGFIVGKGNQSTSGTITIQNGGTVYEDLAINDLHGGGGTAACVNGTSASNSYGLFPFSQYFIQNIEPKMTLEYGAVEKAYYDIQSSQGGQQGAIDFIGSTDSYMFQMLTGASVTKWYDATSDYQCYEVRGKMTMNSLTVSAGSYMKMTSSKFVLPVNNNMEITAKTGATIDMPYSTKFQPGSKLIIEEGAVVDVRKELYFYDYQDWDKYAIAYAQTYGISTSGKKITWHTLRDVSAPSKLGHASLVLNGTINLNEGAAFYTTSHGGNITCTTGTGRIVYNVAGKTTGKDLYECWSTYGKKEGGTALAQGETNKAEGQVQVGKFTFVKTWYIFGTPVATTPAQLKNADGSYLATAGAAANTTITYAKGHWGWIGTWLDKDSNVIAANTVNKLTRAAVEAVTPDSLEAYDADGYQHVFDRWEVDEDKSVAANQELVFVPTFNKVPFITWVTKDASGNNVNTSIVRTNVMPENPASYTAVVDGKSRNHVFVGWNDANGDKVTLTPEYLSNISVPTTFYAKYSVESALVVEEAAEETHDEETGTTTSSGEVSREESSLPSEIEVHGGTLTITPASNTEPEEQSTINQTGNVTIDGGTVTVQENATLTRDTITISGAAEVNVEGTMEANDNITISSENVTVSGTLSSPTTTISEGGNVTVDGGAIQSDTTTVAAGATLTVATSTSIDKKSEDEEAKAVATVENEGTLHVEEGATLTTNEFVLSASQAAVEDSESGAQTASSAQVTGAGSVQAENIYFILARENGFKSYNWYAVATPWVISVPVNAEGGIAVKQQDGSYKALKLGVDYDLLQYNSKKRAEYGQASGNWDYVEDLYENKTTEAVMKPGVFYMIAFTKPTDAIRFKMASGADFHYADDTDLYYNGENGAVDAENGWNGVANPATYNVNMSGYVGQVYNPDNNTYSDDFDMSSVPVGVPVFIQVGSEGTLAATGETSSIAAAPKRAKNNVFKEIEVRFAAQESSYSDRILIQTENGKEDEYVIGVDLAKAGISSKAAQMWVNRYDAKLCRNTVNPVNNSAVYPLGLYAPQAGEYVIRVPKDQETDDMLYLTYDGRIIWNLSCEPYSLSLEKGNNMHYGLRLVRSNAPAVTTDLEQSATTGNQSQILKVLIDGQVYILRGGEMYTLTGQKAQ